jgi:hypothetical protein
MRYGSLRKRARRLLRSPLTLGAAVGLRQPAGQLPQEGDPLFE